MYSHIEFCNPIQYNTLGVRVPSFSLFDFFLSFWIINKLFSFNINCALFHLRFRFLNCFFFLFLIFVFLYSPSQNKISFHIVPPLIHAWGVCVRVFIVFFFRFPTFCNGHWHWHSSVFHWKILLPFIVLVVYFLTFLFFSFFFLVRKFLEETKRIKRKAFSTILSSLLPHHSMDFHNHHQ